MLYLLYGDNKTASRERRISLMNEYRDKKAEIEVLEGKNIDVGRLKEILAARSLFGQEKVVFIDNLLSGLKILPRKAAKNELISYLADLDKEVDLVLWEGKQINKSILSSVANFKTEVFKIPNIMFSFLDGLGFDKEKSWEKWQKLLTGSSEEFVFLMIIRQVRFLYLSKFDKLLSGPSDFKRLAGWQVSKLTRQAKLFSINELAILYRKCLKIDMEIKTGASALGLKSELEKLILAFY